MGWPQHNGKALYSDPGGSTPDTAAVRRDGQHPQKIWRRFRLLSWHGAEIRSCHRGHAELAASQFADTQRAYEVDRWELGEEDGCGCWQQPRTDQGGKDCCLASEKFDSKVGIPLSYQPAIDASENTTSYSLWFGYLQPSTRAENPNLVVYPFSLEGIHCRSSHTWSVLTWRQQLQTEEDRARLHWTSHLVDNG